MRKIYFSFTGFFALALTTLVFSTLTSCGGKTGESTDMADTNSAPAYTISPELETLIGKFKESTDFPYTVDTALMQKEKLGDSLTSADVRMMNMNWFQHSLCDEVLYELGDYYKIDSVKAVGKYKEFCDSLKIGNTKTSNIYAISKIKFNNDTWILVWAHRAASYEACPYFASTNIYFSVVYKGVISQSFRMGEHMAAGDPPVSMERRVTSTFSKTGRLILDVEQENDEDMDAPEIEFTKEHYEFMLLDGKLQMKKEQKEEPKKVKRKVENNK